jgi:glycosyltransferase involved in cell wall biosynthesis
MGKSLGKFAHLTNYSIVSTPYAGTMLPVPNMRFAIDAHAVGRHLTGNEVYIRNLLRGFAQERDAEFIAYVSGKDAAAMVPAPIRTRRISANPFVRLGLDLSTSVLADRPDLLHVQYTAPLACPVPVVVTVHDVSFLDHPEYFPRKRAWQLQLTVRRTVKQAARVLTVSEFSRCSILRAYPELDPDKVVVIPNAASGFRPISRELAREMVENRFSISAPFLLSVGDLQPRKNHIGLIRAFARMIKQYPQFPHSLVLAGQETWFGNSVREAALASGVADRIRFCGFVSDAELLNLYNACDFSVFPSFYEGFGLPVLEAMACGRAVACSATSALPEVANGAAILFDPDSVDEIARAMADLLLDSELKARMERQGSHRAAHFSWQDTAKKTLDVFYEVAELRHRVPQPVPTATAAH